MSKNALYIIPTYHPAAEKLLMHLNSEFTICFYNRNANQRIKALSHKYDFIDFNVSKITLSKFDFSITNTFSIAYYVIKHKPQIIVTEDYLFSLPYLMAGKLIGTKLIYFNGSSSPASIRVKNVIVRHLKKYLLNLFNEYWHGFHGAEKYTAQYVKVDSKLVPWFRLERPEVPINLDAKVLEGVFVGEFNARKRIEYTLELENISRLTQPTNVRLELIGCSPKSRHYRTEYKAQSHSKILDILKTKHFLCLFSQREPMGAVILEALAHGLFVIISKEVGARSIIELEASEECSTQGILYVNRIGCIVDTETINPEALNKWITKNSQLIKKNRVSRINIVSDYFST